MNRRKRLLVTPLVVVAAVAWGTAAAVPSGGSDQPYTYGAAPAKHAQQPGGESHWNDHFQGRGNVTNSRCLGMSRGPNCITANSRKEAARRAAAARKAAQGSHLPGAVNPVKGGPKQ
jgi:hypothetical protein